MNEDSKHILDFEKPLLELESKIQELKQLSDREEIDVAVEIDVLQKKAGEVQKEIYSRLSPWQRIQLARHPDHPYTLDYVTLIAEDFVELHGDRRYRDDPAVIGGLLKLDGRKFVLIGHQKGRDTKENLLRNFGSPHPEGYRKARRLMKLADKFKVPLLCLIDTPGAFPGIGAEERGQAQAIAENLKLMLELKVPIIVVIIGEGGSGGALGIGVGDRVLIMENAYYSVISPEGCAAILWKSKKHAPDAAQALKLTPRELLELNVVDEIITEPLTGAHRDGGGAAELVKESILKCLAELEGLPVEELIRLRLEKYRRLGTYGEKRK